MAALSTDTEEAAVVEEVAVETAGPAGQTI
jgi:hypothetical protein